MPPKLAAILSALTLGAFPSPEPATPPPAAAAAEPDTQSEYSGVITEEIRAALTEAGLEIAALEKEVGIAKAALADVAKERDAFKAKAEENEETIRARVRNEELAALAASQGVPPADLPAQPAVSNTENEPLSDDMFARAEQRRAAFAKK